MTPAVLAALLLAAFVVAFVVAWFWATRGQRARERDVAADAQRLLDAARTEAETVKRDSAIEAKEGVAQGGARTPQPT